MTTVQDINNQIENLKDKKAVMIYEHTIQFREENKTKFIVMDWLIVIMIVLLLAD
jgi:hypothetical protein